MEENKKLIDYLVERAVFTNNDIETLVDLFTYSELTAGQFFICTGELVKKIGFNLEGIICACNFTENSERTISYFVTENHFFSEANSLFKDEPARLNIQAVTSCKMLVADIEELKKLDGGISGLNEVIAAIGLEEMTDIMDMQELPRKGEAINKIQNFREKYPILWNRLKGSEIAEYLGITQFTLSRIKKQNGW